MVIYGDGQVLIKSGEWGLRTFTEAQVTPAEMCRLRRQIESTGFLQPHTEYYTQREGSDGAPGIAIQVDDTYYSFYGPDVPHLVDDLAAGYRIIENYRPNAPLEPYTPTYLALWVEEVMPTEEDTPVPWPSELPPIAELWSDRERNTVIIDGEWVLPIYELFSRHLSWRVFQEGDSYYGVIARPVLPHETPRNFPVYPGPPLDYVPVLECEGEASLISPAIPTTTPTLTAAAAALKGQGRILFVSSGYGNSEVYVMEADGSGRTRLTNNLANDDEPAWSPDGQHIAFVSDRDGDQEIYVMAADGTNVVQLTQNEVEDYSPTWSPDGTQIAFVTDRDGGWQESEIYLMNANGSQPRRLTANLSRDLSPVWSPDGTKIAFLRELAFNATYALFLLHLNQLGAVMEERLENAYLLPRPAWSPDSSEIALLETIGRADPHLRYVGLDGSVRPGFTLAVRYPWSPDWSSDGAYVVFAAYELTGDREIFIAELATGSIIQLTFTEGDESSPAWWP
ncbi:MAG: hypothetical protein AB1791_13500 [Chloroflexota bacterium]